MGSASELAAIACSTTSDRAGEPYSSAALTRDLTAAVATGVIAFLPLLMRMLYTIGDESGGFS